MVHYVFQRDPTLVFLDLRGTIVATDLRIPGEKLHQRIDPLGVWGSDTMTLHLFFCNSHEAVAE